MAITALRRGATAELGVLGECCGNIAAEVTAGSAVLGRRMPGTGHA